MDTGIGRLMFNKITETGICTPVRSIDETGHFTSPNYLLLPAPIVITPTVTVTQNKSFSRILTNAVHVTQFISSRNFARTITIAVHGTVNLLRAFNKTLTVNVNVAVGITRQFTRTIIMNVLLDVRTNKNLARTFVIPVTFTVSLMRNAGFIMRTKAVGLVGKVTNVVNLYYENHEQVK